MEGIDFKLPCYVLISGGRGPGGTSTKFNMHPSSCALLGSGLLPWYIPTAQGGSSTEENIHTARINQCQKLIVRGDIT